MLNNDALSTLISTNAKNFGIELLQNKDVVNMLLSHQIPNLSENENEKIAQIFENLIQIKKDCELSAT